MKKLNGIGVIDGNALTLTQAMTRECGHLLAEGVDGGNEARAARANVRAAAQKVADETGKPVEVFATRRGAQEWIVDVVEPAS